MSPEAWVQKFCQEHSLDWDKLAPPDRRAITRAIPCDIRCWRVGGPVTVKRGEPCPECGRPVPLLTSWERILLDEGQPVV